MRSDVLFAQRFAEITKEYANATSDPRLVRIFNHYLDRVQKGMSVNIAIDLASRDVCGDNHHPTKKQRSDFGDTKQED
jgi:hypothetical protein